MRPQTTAAGLTLVVAAAASLVVSRGISSTVSAALPANGGPAQASISPAPLLAIEAGEKRARELQEPIRLYREFFGLPTVGGSEQPGWKVRGKLAKQKVKLDISAVDKEQDREKRGTRRGASTADEETDQALKAIANRAKDRAIDYQLEFLIALVADPIDSRLASDFDLTMSALQQAMAEGNYKLDRQWLPWSGQDAAEEKVFRTSPGILLFRGDPIGPQGKHRLAAVLLVGENPKAGIQKEAFRNAVYLILELTRLGAARVSEAPEIPILGPYFSGSTESLRIALQDTLSSGLKPTFRIVSGSATADDLPQVLESGALTGSVTFARTVAPAVPVAKKALGFFKEKLGWDLGHVALLIENDTVFGQGFDNDTLGEANSPLDEVKTIRFPSSLVALRNAWEESGFTSAFDASGHSKTQPAATALEVSLRDPQAPVDIVPQLSPLTVRIEDMACADLLRRLSREKINYLGILATDVKDEVFLAERIRRWSPDISLFVFDSNMLFVHPQYNDALFGALIE